MESFKEYLEINGSLNEAKKIIVTKISDIDNLKSKVNDGKVTYRGLGMGAKSDRFWDASGGKRGVEITVDKKKYFITKDDFESLGGSKKIKFNAPYRMESKTYLNEDTISNYQKMGHVLIDDPDLSKEILNMTDGKPSKYDYEYSFGETKVTDKQFFKSIYIR